MMKRTASFVRFVSSWFGIRFQHKDVDARDKPGQGVV
jgi:hypothetical protein